ncbi:Zinc finger C2H2-type protein [Neofusicoccum parvum]|uniref:Zinc finger C2H2-type protein n=1 Tax=Neofusicoccum parvum TaxID=310453 RepID=A0ACB5RW92_9PEZI|nr:Zinc finger C2H2-type protein [Neofusicoccum parvum]
MSVLSFRTKDTALIKCHRDYCDSCERWFRNIRAHYTHSSKHVYCERCNRNFVSVDARQMHWDNSCAHNLCDECGFDGEDWDELEDHFREHGCYPYTCHGCNTWFRSYPSYSRHTEAVVACPTCDKHCVNQNNLDQHMISHAVAKLECWGCYRKFIYLSHMVLHLESGTCPSGCRLHDINYTLMGQCNNLRRFVSPDYVQDFRHGIDIQKVYGRAFPFECKGCGDVFRLLSGLCQHMENSNTCDQHISSVSFRSLQNKFERKFL